MLPPPLQLDLLDLPSLDLSMFSLSVWSFPILLIPHAILAHVVSLSLPHRTPALSPSKDPFTLGLQGTRRNDSTRWCCSDPQPGAQCCPGGWAANPAVTSCGLLSYRNFSRLESGNSKLSLFFCLYQGCPTFWCLWATLEEKELSWVTH